MDWFNYGGLGVFFVVDKKIKPGLTYQLLNLFAATLMAIGLFPRNAWFSFAVQIVWAFVAIFAIAKMKKK